MAPNFNTVDDQNHLAASIRRRDLPIPLDWPKSIGPEAFHGLAGDVVRTIEDHTESDSTAILFQLLVLLGNVIGRSAHFMVEATKHYLNLFCVLVGRTAGGRKGTSFGQAKRLFADADPEWLANRFVMGLSSGEGLIYQVRDPLEKQGRTKKDGRGSRSVVADEGVADKRLLVIEQEFASTLTVMRRDGNTLSTAIRQAWDGGDLRTMTKNEPQKASGAHISIVGHITTDELLGQLSSTEQSNGFANRFLWVAARQSKLLPDGGNLPAESLQALQKRIANVVGSGRRLGLMPFSAEAQEAWFDVYCELQRHGQGLVPNLTARSQAQVRRIACLYAVLDRSAEVGIAHLRAAEAAWRYSEACVQYIFEGDRAARDASTISEALLMKAGGLTRTEVSALFRRNKDSQQIDEALNVLQSRGMARKERPHTSAGRPAERWFAIVAPSS